MLLLDLSVIVRSHGMFVDSLLFYCFFVYTLINLAVIFNWGVKRVDDLGIGGCVGVDEPMSWGIPRSNSADAIGIGWMVRLHLRGIAMRQQ